MCAGRVPGERESWKWGVRNGRERRRMRFTLNGKISITHRYAVFVVVYCARGVKTLIKPTFGHACQRRAVSLSARVQGDMGELTRETTSQL